MKPTLVSLCLCLGTVIVAGCNNGPGNFEGTIAGNALEVKETVYYRQPFSTSFGGSNVSVGSAVALFMSDREGTCDLIKANQIPPNATGFLILLAVSRGQYVFDADLSRGDYRLISLLDAVNPPGSGTGIAFPAFAKYDGTCTNVVGQDGSATSGSVTVDDELSGNDNVRGSFDLTFGTDAATGSFNAKFCDYDAPSTPPTPTCQ